MTLLQLVVNGLALGAAYALVALGFVFIVNATVGGQFCARRPCHGRRLCSRRPWRGRWRDTGHRVAAAGGGDHVRGRRRGLVCSVFSARQPAAFHRVHQHVAVRHHPAKPVSGAVRAAGARRAAADQERHASPRQHRDQHSGARHACGGGGTDCAPVLHLLRAPRSAAGFAPPRKIGRWRRRSASALRP